MQCFSIILGHLNTCSVLANSKSQTSPTNRLSLTFILLLTKFWKYQEQFRLRRWLQLNSTTWNSNICKKWQTCIHISKQNFSKPRNQEFMKTQFKKILCNKIILSKHINLSKSNISNKAAVLFYESLIQSWLVISCQIFKIVFLYDATVT